MAILVSVRNEKIAQWEAYLDRCGVFMTDEYKILYELLTSKNKEKKEREKLYEEMSIEQERQNEIEELVHSSSSPSKINDLFFKIENFLALNFKEMTNVQAYKEMRSFEETLSDYGSGYYVQMAKVILALTSDNESRAKTEFFKFLNFHPAKSAFEVHSGIFRGEWTRERFETLLMDIGLRVGNYFKKGYPLETDVFMTIMQDLLVSRKFDSVSSQYETQWSLARLREAMEVPYRKKEYPSFWYSQLAHRTSSSQLEQYIDFLFEHKKQLEVDALWIFTESLPNEESKREFLREKAEIATQRGGYYEFVVLEISRNEAFKRLMAEHDKKWGRSDFQLRRSVLRKLFLQGIAPEFMIFFLLEVGDYNDDYLWLLANRI